VAGRRRVEISRPGKALFPDGISKLDLARYYEAVATVTLPHLANRPLNLERYPDGIAGERIMQQRAGKYFPEWIKRARVPKKGGSVDHPVATEPASLVYLAGQACITLHRWLSRVDRLDRPDLLIVDLDPSQGATSQVGRAARVVREQLQELELEPWIMSTGSRGYHVVVPLQRRCTFDQLRPFARDLAVLLAARQPRLFTIEQRKAKRGARILLDVMRNTYGHTAVAPYAVRARAGAPVATPLHWEELADRRTRPDRWSIGDIPRRLERDGDPWERIGRQARTIGRARALLEQALVDAGRPPTR
jgi:bifunctional non-homologous end joining protein LigD